MCIRDSFINGQLAKLGAASKRLESHNTFVSKLQDSIEAGIGNLVDADMAKEAARLQACLLYTSRCV